MIVLLRTYIRKVCLYAFPVTLAALLIATKAEAAATFATAANISAGTNPQAIAIADFNGDSVNDLAVINNGDNNVSVFLGTGSGTFGAATNFSVGSGPSAIVAADVSGDNNQDIVVANGSGTTVSVLIGNGAGSFAAKVNYTAVSAGAPSGLAVADVDGANGKDLLVTNGDSIVTLLLNNGSGVFGAASSAGTVGATPTGIITADLDGDSDNDFINVNGDGDTISIGLNNGLGSFTLSTKAVGDDPVAVTSGDFDGDGDQDLAVANYFDNNVSVLIGAGNGTFATAVNYSVAANPFSVTAADLDGDGKIDLATANNTGNNASVLIGTGTGTFGAATNFTTGTTATFVRAATLNGDSKVDLAVANYGDNNVSILLNTTATASGGAGLSEFRRRLQSKSARQYAARDAYTPKNLVLRAENCTSAQCGAVLQFASPNDAELNRFSLYNSANKQRIPFTAERAGESVSFHFPWPSNAELPARVCFTNTDRAEFCAEARIWTPAAFTVSDVRIERLRMVKDQSVVAIHIPSFNNFSYVTAGKSLVLVKVYDADRKLVLRQSVNRPDTIQLSLNQKQYTLCLTPVNAAGEKGETIKIPLDVYLLTTGDAQERLLDVLIVLLNQLRDLLNR